MPGKAVGRWLEDRCQKAGFSLREAGRKAGVSHSTIRDIMNGTSIPSPRTIRKLAGAFTDGHNQSKALEDTLLVLAGHVTKPEAKAISEPMARLLDIISDFSEPQLKVMTRFADFLAEVEAKR